MTNHKIQFVGTPCGHHGNYTFYKALKYSLHGKQKILTLGEFFFIKVWEEEDIISIGEAQLLWEEKSSGQILISLRLYFLPENTPEGRCDEHGECTLLQSEDESKRHYGTLRQESLLAEVSNHHFWSFRSSYPEVQTPKHEVVSLSEKVVLRAEDVISIMRAASGVKWDAGLKGVYGPLSAESSDNEETPHYTSPLSQALDIKEILREKNIIGDVIDSNTLHVIVLSYDSYCRMRGLLKRLEGVAEEVMKYKIVKALGGFLVPSKKTRLMFCRDIFEYPELEGHDLLCNHLAPKLQGRPRKKKGRRGDSESESSENSEEQKPRLKGKPGFNPRSGALIRTLTQKTNYSPKVYHNIPPAIPHQIKNEFSTPALDRLIEVDFMSKLYKFMKDRNAPITRLPCIGYRQLNVFELFTRVQQLGGYEVVGQKKLWKHLYESLVGKQMQYNLSPQTLHTSGVTGLKKHYERLLLPYENFLLQEQKRILGIDTQKPFNKSQKYLQKHHKQRIYSQSYHKQNLQQNQTHPQMKGDPGEPSVSILQPAPPTEPIGASFQVADGGSTTITLVPISEEDPVAATSSESPIATLSHPRQTFSLTPQARNSPSPHFGSESELSIPVPRVNTKRDEALPSDLAKRPEITITPIPRTIGPIGVPGALTPLQLADLMTLNVNLNSPLGVSALQDLAKIAERYDRVACEPSPKRLRSEDGTWLNGANQQNSSPLDRRRAEHHFGKGVLPVPDLVSPELLRQMSAIETNSKLLLPAHQSTKTINALAALLPQTSIFPAPAPAAHQQHSHVVHKPQSESSKPEPVFQSLSVYSQSKNIYGKPTADVTKDKGNSRSSPEIEILDLRVPHESRNNHKSKSDRLEIELLDLSTRRDITVSAVPKPGTSRSQRSTRIPPPQVSIKSTDMNRSGHFMGLPGGSSLPFPLGLGNKQLSSQESINNSVAALASAFAAQGFHPSALAGLGLGSPLFNYIMSSGMKQPSPHGSMPMIPIMDPATLATYYSLLPPGLLAPGNGPHIPSNSVAAQQAVAAAAAAQLAQFSSLGLSGFPNMSPEAMASLGIYKNYMPQGTLPAPHFLSGLMSPGGSNPPTSN